MKEKSKLNIILIALFGFLLVPYYFILLFYTLFLDYIPPYPEVHEVYSSLLILAWGAPMGIYFVSFIFFKTGYTKLSILTLSLFLLLGWRIVSLQNKIPEIIEKKNLIYQNKVAALPRDFVSDDKKLFAFQQGTIFEIWREGDKKSEAKPDIRVFVDSDKSLNFQDVPKEEEEGVSGSDESASEHNKTKRFNDMILPLISLDKLHTILDLKNSEGKSVADVYKVSKVSISLEGLPSTMNKYCMQLPDSSYVKVSGAAITLTNNLKVAELRLFGDSYMYLKQKGYIFEMGPNSKYIPKETIPADVWEMISHLNYDYSLGKGEIQKNDTIVYRLLEVPKEKISNSERVLFYPCPEEPSY